MGETLDQTIVLGSGCFWTLEVALQNINGIIQTTVGYAGGTTRNPTGQEVASGNTDQARVVQIKYDSRIITTEKILELFFFLHNPTLLNQYENDRGTQYRSIILYTTPEQKIIAEKIMTKQQRKFKKTLQTILQPFEIFYPAEPFYQKYYQRNPHKGYYQSVIVPKLEKMKKYL